LRLAVAVLVSVVVSEPALAAAKLAASGRYVCDDGREVVFTEAAYGTVFKREGREIMVGRRAAFGGFAYAGSGVSLRGRGAEGNKTLTINGLGPVINCKAVPAVATPGVAAGTVISKVAMTLPAGAVLTVELRDAARADAAAPLLGRVQVTPRGTPVPMHWWLAYDAKRTAHPARPALSARITDAAGKLIWVSDTFTPLPVAGREFAPAEIGVVPVGAGVGRK
jgi:putative lipoprotein